MDSDDYRFYDDYEPEPNVSNSLNEAADDYQLSAPYRDLLGILEAEQAWSEEDAIDAATVLEKLEEWDENARTRSETPPQVIKTIHNQFDDLYEVYLVYKENSDNKNIYYKLPDGDINPPIVRETAAKLTRIADSIEKILFNHDLVIISVFVYIIGSVLMFFHPFGMTITITAAIIFLFGHWMAYRNIPLFK